MRADDKKLRSRFATVIAAGWLGTVGLLTFGFPASNRYMGRVVSISETAQVVVLKDGRPESFRLAEVEFPEKGQPHAKAARAFANRLALGRDVHVEESRLRDGKRIGYVSLPGGRNLSAELVEAGLAWPSVQRRGPLASSLAVLQMRAMSDRRGLWSEARTTSVFPAAPAAWRSSSAGDLAVRGNDESEGEAPNEATAADEPPAAEAGDAALGAN
ncbi:MAG TPA: thermonuclease family protein [Thermoanaerobaculia bacterium]